MKIYIYSFINKINGHRYIGKTNNMERRKREHRSMAYNPKIIGTDRDYLWFKKIRQYGWENFDHEILEIANENNWKEREQYWIKYYNTFDGVGYNTTPGGDGENNNCVLSEEEVKDIYMALINTDESQYDIAFDFGVSSTLISNINQGLRYVMEGYSFPLRKNYKTGLEEYGELIDLLQHSILSFKEIANRLGVAESSVKKINYGKMQYDKNFNYPIRKFDTRTIKKIQRDIILTDLTIEEIAINNKVSVKRVKDIISGKVLFNSILKYPLRS